MRSRARQLLEDEYDREVIFDRSLYEADTWLTDAIRHTEPEDTRRRATLEQARLLVRRVK